MTVRVLVVAAPLLGHVPLATALRAAGNEVLVAAGGVADRVGGLPAHDLAPGSGSTARPCECSPPTAGRAPCSPRWPSARPSW